MSRLRPTIAAVAAAAVLTLALGMQAVSAADKVVVAVTAIDEHPALNACREGVRAALKAAGYEEGKNLTFVFESAHGDPAVQTQIARKFAREKPSVIVPISTPSAQAVVAAAIGTPVIFAAVTDPLGANLVRDMHTPGGNVTGTSDLSPVKSQIDLIRKITPSARRIGVLFNPQESNSHTLVYLMKRTALAANMDTVEAPARKASDVSAAARGLVGKADVIFVPTDSTIASAVEDVVKVGVDNRIPVYAGDIDLVRRGAIAAIGTDYYNLGWQTGNIVVRVLRGEKPGGIPVAVAEKAVLDVNPHMAMEMGVTIPPDVLSQADGVIQ